jgi:hypothetical protein
VKSVPARFDRATGAAARWLLAWTARSLGPSHRTWIDAMRAELEAIDGGGAQFAWALGGLQLGWVLQGRRMVALARRGKRGRLVGAGLGAVSVLMLAATMLPRPS